MNIETTAEQPHEPQRRGNRRSIDWAPILADLAANPELSRLEIAKRNDVSARALRRQIRKAADAPATDRTQIIDRLFRLIGLQVQDLQREMTVMHEENRRSGEKEVVLLGKIAANLEKLMVLDGTGPTSDKKGKRRTKEIVDLRTKLIERIEHLKRQ